ncbi:serine hydrolase [Microlunatus lacustris]
MQRELSTALSTGDPQLQLVRSVLVSVDGKTVVTHYHDRTARDRAHVWSVTKSVVSILVGIAVDDGLLRVDQPLRELLPEHRGSMSPQQETITLHQLLTMTAGLSADDGGMNLLDDDPVGQILSYGMANDPGASFQYANSSAHLVAAVLAKAVDRPLLSYARERLFDPLGIDTRPAWQGQDTGLSTSGFTMPGFGWARDASGLHIGALGLKLTAPDLLKLGQLYVDGGQWRGGRIVSEDWVRASTSPQLTDDQADNPDGQYGYLWWPFEYGGTTGFNALGSYSQRILCFPEQAAVIVVTADDMSGTDSLNLTLDPVLLLTVVDPLLA